jgi:hypothetical protein
MTTQDLRLMALKEAPVGLGGMIRDRAQFIEAIKKSEIDRSSWLSI